jgi:protein-L-isoaspartate(D-aspartate) O-methyltransferase
MIDSQLRVSGVNDPAILAAFAAIPREDFVPAERRAVAYADRAVPLGDGTVLAPALTHGQMLTAAEPVPADTALVIGKPAPISPPWWAGWWAASRWPRPVPPWRAVPIR